MLEDEIFKRLIDVLIDAAVKRGCSRDEIVKETLEFIKDLEESERDQRRQDADKLIIP